MGIAAVVGGSNSAGLLLPHIIVILLATSLAGKQILRAYITAAILGPLGVWFGALRPDKKRADNWMG